MKHNQETNKAIVLGCVYANPKNYFYSGRGAVYDVNGISPTITTMQGGGNHKMVIMKSNKQVTIYDDYNSKIIKGGVIGTITPNCGNSSLRNGIKIIEQKN